MKILAKKFLAIIGTTLMLGTGCVSQNNPFKTSTNLTITPEKNVVAGEVFSYTSLDELTPIYDEHDSLAGYFVKGTTSKCGSDCTAELLFIDLKNVKPSIRKVENFESDSLGFQIYGKDTYTYISNFIWRENEGHFGCHSFKIQKMKFINEKPEILETIYSAKKYAFDLGDAQGKCQLFPGIEKALKDKGL